MLIFSSIIVVKKSEEKCFTGKGLIFQANDLILKLENINFGGCVGKMGTLFTICLFADVSRIC